MFQNLGESTVTLVITILIVIALATLCVFLFSKLLEGYNLKKKKNQEEKVEVAVTLDEKPVDIKDDIREKINSQVSKVKRAVIEYANDTVNNSMSNVLATSMKGKKRFVEKQVVNEIGEAVNNTYEDVIKESRNKFSQNNEELIEIIETKIKNYVIDNNEKDYRGINKEINELLSESMTIYSKEVEQILTRQSTSLKMQIGMNIDKQLKAMKGEIKNSNNIKLDDFEKNLKSHTNNVMDVCIKQSKRQINQMVDNINDEFEELKKKGNYEKISENIKKNIEELEESYMTSVQKNVDCTIEIVNSLSRLGITDYKTIKDDEIIDVFKEALISAKSEIDIVTPWINNHVMYKEKVYTLMKEALNREVRIRIIYGLGSNKDSDIEEMERGLERIADTIKDDFNSYGKLFEIKKGDTCEKVLICDENLALIGNFNFLSFHGKYSENKNLKSQVVAVITEKRAIQKLRKEKIKF
ncbi:hypothetical protein GCM10008908_25560 [Clostridium subterminale]|uniref:PLD phosphodiesterase domain-containing protein n=1 Tax=Clostridium subterminale TaxID=1550 RepID=A0ABP3W5W9_CLOSU